MKKILTLIGFFTITGLARIFLVAVAGGFFLLQGDTSHQVAKSPPKTITLSHDMKIRDCRDLAKSVKYTEDNGVTVYRPQSDKQRQSALLSEACKAND
ncbi:MAG: hypothetical protein MRY59_03355 [Aquisalinus sp.]|nr:hypothetical protein [Aquisalinus sp.]